MWKAASRVVCHRRVTTLCHLRAVLTVGLALCAVALVLLLSTLPQPCVLHGQPRVREPEIPYWSGASAYWKRATYVAPLPRGRLYASVENAAEAAANRLPPPPPQLPPGVETRARRQEALEEEIHKYLVAHGIHRERRLRVRFMVVGNFVGFQLCATLGAAALAGYSIPVTGFDHMYFAIGRFWKYIEFADREDLDDDDIIVTMDDDIIWSGADFLPFLSKFARLSPETEADLDVAAVRAWEDYGEKRAPLFMKELQAQAEAAGGTSVKRPELQMPPIVTNGEENCWWAQHAEGFVDCGVAFTAMDHLIEVARNHVSSYDMNRSNHFIPETGDVLRAELAKLFSGQNRWMMDDLLRQPNASSPYTAKAKRDPNDPLFYQPFVVNRTNPTPMLNSGLQVSRVWALRRLVKTMGVYAAMEKPVPEQGWRMTLDWKCDQGTIGQIYARSRLFEVEHNLLTGPPLSARTPPVQHDLRFGPPGLIGIDRRTEMVVIVGTLVAFPKLFRHSAYLDRTFPARDGSGANITEVHLGSSDPKGGRLGGLRTTRTGALVTPPLLWRSATVEDRLRGFENEVEDDPDVVRPPFIHYAGGNKDQRFIPNRHLYSWLVAARHDGRAKWSIAKVLREELVELWYERNRIYVNYSRTCNDIAEPPA